MIFKRKNLTLSERVDGYRARNKEYYEYHRNWHRFFAWYPVPISADETVWLSYVERKFDSVSEVVRWRFWPRYRKIGDSGDGFRTG